MTHRTEGHQPSPTEKAAAHVLDGVHDLVDQAFTIHKPPMPREQFRAMIARVLDTTTENSWRERFGLHQQQEHT